MTDQQPPRPSPTRFGLVLLIGLFGAGGLGMVTMLLTSSNTVTTTDRHDSSDIAGAVRTTAELTSSTSTTAPTTTSTTAAPTTTTTTTIPAVESTEVVEIPIPYSTVEQNDPLRPIGERATAQTGVRGVRTVTFRVRRQGDRELDRTQVSDVVSTPPVVEIISVGSYVAPPTTEAPPEINPLAESGDNPDSGGCDPNYSGCVPIASDVDCSGGSGNGPAYTTGPVQVIGSDQYGLDRDGDGIGCEDG